MLMINENNKLETISNLFEGNEIRSVWNSEKEEYYFSIIDVISALTDSNIPKRYWSDLKRKLTEEGSQLYENIVQLKIKSRERWKKLFDRYTRYKRNFKINRNYTKFKSRTI